MKSETIGELSKALAKAQGQKQVTDNDELQALLCGMTGEQYLNAQSFLANFKHADQAQGQ